MEFRTILDTSATDLVVVSRVPNMFVAAFAMRNHTEVDVASEAAKKLLTGGQS